MVADGLPVFEGKRPAQGKVAIILIFQPNGIAESTLTECEWLHQNGYAPLIVSNCPLSSTDIARLAPVTWRTVERPNFGYDFGGYRDALTMLDQWNIAPETLLILNDSVWVPLSEDRNLLARLEGSPADIAGSIMRFRGETRFLESYCYRIKGRVLVNPDFRAFWSNLRLTSNKYYVIRRGERGFSEAMEQAGLSIEAVYDEDRFMELLGQQDDEFLYKTIRYSAFLPGEMQDERAALLTSRGELWRDRAFGLIGRVLEKRLAYSTFPFAHNLLMDYPFLKKSNDLVAIKWRKAYFAAVEAGDLPRPSQAIFEELAEMQGETR